MILKKINIHNFCLISYACLGRTNTVPLRILIKNNLMEYVILDFHNMN